MKKIGVLFFLSLGFLFIPPDVLSQQPSKELEEEKTKEAQKREEELRRTQKALEPELQHRKLMDLQKIVTQQQQSLRETMEWTRFPSLEFSLDKNTVAPNEEIEPKFSLKNGSQKTFWIDGRILPAVYEIYDANDKIVLVSKRPEYTLPQEKDLVQLHPGKAIVFPKVSGLRVKKPGTYTIRGSYVFFAPEGERKKIWAGTLITFPISFTVTEKKTP